MNRIIVDSKRGYVKLPWFQIVYEWEDSLVNNLPRCILKNVSLFERYLDVFFMKTGLRCQNMFVLGNPWGGRDVHLTYEMSALTCQTFNNRKNVIPIIIDYFLQEEDLAKFDLAHSNNPIVIVTSKEVYEKIKGKSKLNLHYWPLSLPEKYIFETDRKYEKKYDIAINGRRNPQFDVYLKRYIEDHPEMTWVTSGSRRFDFVDNKGVNIGYFETREDFIKLLRMTKIALYSTPSMDGSRPDANGWNQVTPKFLEYISSQCHVLMRYNSNPDTDYYELTKFSGNIESYEDFEEAMDAARREEVNIEEYKEYLDKHSTKCVTSDLYKILEKL